MLWHCWLQVLGLWHSSSSTQDTWSSDKVNPGRQEHRARPLSARHWSWQPPLFTSHGSSARQVRPSRANLYLCHQPNNTITSHTLSLPPQPNNVITTQHELFIHSKCQHHRTIHYYTHLHHPRQHYSALNQNTHAVTTTPIIFPSHNTPAHTTHPLHHHHHHHHTPSPSQSQHVYSLTQPKNS